MDGAGRHPHPARRLDGTPQALHATGADDAGLTEFVRLPHDNLHDLLFVTTDGGPTGVLKVANPAFPAKDAGDFTKSWDFQKRKLFREVVVKLITNEQATRDNVMDGLEWLQKQVTQKDTAIAFFAAPTAKCVWRPWYFQSAGFTPAALTRIKTSSAFGSGRGACSNTSTSGPP